MLDKNFSHTSNTHFTRPLLKYFIQFIITDLMFTATCQRSSFRPGSLYGSKLISSIFFPSIFYYLRLLRRFIDFIELRLIIIVSLQTIHRCSNGIIFFPSNTVPRTAKTLMTTIHRRNPIFELIFRHNFIIYDTPVLRFSPHFFFF